MRCEYCNNKYTYKDITGFTTETKIEYTLQCGHCHLIASKNYNSHEEIREMLKNYEFNKDELTTILSALYDYKCLNTVTWEKLEIVMKKMEKYVGKETVSRLINGVDK